MVPLLGVGVWVWERMLCERGDPAAMAAKASAHGVSHLIVKIGEEHPNGQVDRALVDGLRSGRVECAGWWYCRPRGFDAQVDMLRAARDLGVRHFVMDAEDEWDSPDNRLVAAQFAKRLRAELGDVYLADAPWARPISHRAPFFPYAEFGSVMNARCPQFYWEMAEAKGEPYAHFVETADLEWEHTDPHGYICPAGSCVDYTGQRHCPPDELRLFLQRYRGRPSCSVWSWQHLLAAEWGVIREFATAAVDVTDGGEDRPVHPPVDPEAG